MKRNVQIQARKAPDAIFTSDWHLREDQPTCRTDNFWQAQWDKVDQIIELQTIYHCPIIHAGDLFHHWKPSPYLLNKTMEHIGKGFYSIAGQHDLPQHNFDLIYKSGIGVLHTANALRLIDGSWGQEPGEFPIQNRRIGVWHKFVWDGEKIPWPGCDEITAKEVLKKYQDFDVIVTGDHHKPFIYEYKGRLLVNCGCLTRQDASYMDHRPRVWFYYVDTNRVEPHYLEAAQGVVSREHLITKEERENRLDAFISRLSDDWELSLSFEDNLKAFLSKNKVKNTVKDLIYKAMDHE